ncbi:unnamed protein product, partial [Staurois parvus]
WCAVSLRHSVSPIHGKSRRCRLGHVISCVQSQLITWDMYTDHQSTDDLCSPSSANCQCPSVPAVSAHPCHLPVPISDTFQCPSVPHFSALQCTSMPHISAHLSFAFQCHPSVPPINASQCHLSVPVSAAYQCASVLPISAGQCCLSVPHNSAAYQCHI